LWIVAKRDILYSESVGSGTGLWVVGDDKEEDQEEDQDEDAGSALEDYPPYPNTFKDSASGEYGAADYTSDEGESVDFETDEGGSEGYAADEDVSADDASEDFASDVALDRASDAASEVSLEVASDEGSGKDSSETLLRWRGWNMESLPTCLESYGKLLNIARHQLGLRAEDHKKVYLSRPLNYGHDDNRAILGFETG
jgi:hypothetical protein